MKRCCGAVASEKLGLPRTDITRDEKGHPRDILYVRAELTKIKMDTDGKLMSIMSGTRVKINY